MGTPCQGGRTTSAPTPARLWLTRTTACPQRHVLLASGALAMPVRRVALLTAGGLAPCLSSAVGGLIERYTQVAPDIEIIGYLDGYAGLLAGRHLEVTPQVRANAHLLHRFGGSPIGNSRVKLTNVAGLRQARAGAGGPGPAARGRRAADARRRRRPAHHRRRRHQHDGRRSGRLPALQRLRADGRRAAEDGRQRRRARSGRASARGRPPSRARCSPATSSPSTPRTPACSSCTRSWAATAAG